MESKKLTKETILSLGVEEKNYPDFAVGDTISVKVKVIEGDKERYQDFNGTLIGEKGRGINKTIRVRKIGVGGIGVERIFSYYSPLIKEIKVIARGIVRRAKLYYLRHKKGKAAIVKKKLKGK